MADGRTFLKQVADLVPERPHVPALGAAQVCVEITLEWNEFDEMAPRQFSRQRRDNLQIWKIAGRIELSATAPFR